MSGEALQQSLSDDEHRNAPILQKILQQHFIRRQLEHFRTGRGRRWFVLVELALEQFMHELLLTSLDLLKQRIGTCLACLEQPEMIGAEALAKCPNFFGYRVRSPPQVPGSS